MGLWGQRVTDDLTTKSMPPSGQSSVPPEAASFQLRPGHQVGNYVIREQIGEGGFAIVYAAEQEKPVRRKVALKIIKLGMDTKQVIARSYQSWVWEVGHTLFGLTASRGRDKSAFLA